MALGNTPLNYYDLEDDNMKKQTSRILALTITALFIATGFAVLMPIQNASASSTQTFSFPYSYGTPQVPSDVGAQGVQGPNVPISDLGPHGIIGAQGHMGPVNYSGTIPWSDISLSSVTVTVYNGTPSSKVDAVGVSVGFINATFGNTTLKNTSTSGVATFSLSEGWYVLKVNGSSSSWENFTELVNIASSTTSFTVYLLPSSLGTQTINNGLSTATFSSVYVESPDSPFAVTPQYNKMSQMEVQLLNESSSGAILATGYALSNGTVVFTKVNDAYSYAFHFVGYENGESGTLYDIGNATTGTLTFSTAVDVYSSAVNLGGYTKTTGTLTGSPTISHFGSPSITLTANTTITGGVTFISNGLNLGSYNLKFVNAQVFFNDSLSSWGSGANHQFNFVNSTVVFLINAQVGTINATHAVFYAQNMYNPLSTIVASGPFTPITIISAKTNGITYCEFVGYMYIAGKLNNNRYNYVWTVNPGYPLPQIDYTQVGVYYFGGLTASSYVTNSTITNSTLFGPMSSTITVFSNDYVRYNSSTTMFSQDYGYYNNSYLNLTIETSMGSYSLGQEYGLGNGIGNVSMINCFMDFINPSRSIIITFQAPYGNVSYSLLDFNSTTNAAGHFRSGKYYNDIISRNISINAVKAGKWNRAGMALHSTGTYTEYVNYSDIYIGEFAQFGGNNYTYSHDYFGSIIPIDSYAGIESLMAFMHPAIYRITYSNDTFGKFYNNYTLNDIIGSESGSYPGIYSAFGSSNVGPYVPTAGPAYFNVTHVTFQPFWGGNGTLHPPDAPLVINFGEGTPTQSVVVANVSECLFDNSYNYAWGSNKYDVSPYYWDLMIWGGRGTVYDNYFMNLSQQIIPIGSNNNESGSQGNHGQYALIDNHFFYRPAHDQNYVPLFHNMTIETTDSQTVSAMSYQAPLNESNKYTTVSGGTYVSNSSILAKDGMYNNYAWVWNITPDVTIQSGTPTISYSNGLVGGPQPNFTWQGYRYTESVEPSYISVGANSSKAPPVDLEFNGQPNTQYAVAMYDHGSLIDYTNVTSNANGVVTFQYNPATMPLDPVFQLTTFTPIQPPPNGSPISTWNIILIGIAVIIVIGVVIPLVLREK